MSQEQLYSVSIRWGGDVEDTLLVMMMEREADTIRKSLEAAEAAEQIVEFSILEESPETFEDLMDFMKRNRLPVAKEWKPRK